LLGIIAACTDLVRRYWKMNNKHLESSESS
jgi:hypothetical protein